MKRKLLILIFTCLLFNLNAQVDESQNGAWYMYFYNYKIKNSNWGFQGDLQYRDWQGLGDLEQLMLRSGVTYTPEDSDIMFTLGFANITTGEFGDENETFNENRMYQEALFSQKLGNRFFITHRFRYEQRFVENQDFRTRYRYNFFLNIPLNKHDLVPKSYYLALYNELFINGETHIGTGQEVELFDRNRAYLGMGYILTPKVRFQLGWMNQKTNDWGKGQWQISMHHNF